MQTEQARREARHRREWLERVPVPTYQMAGLGMGSLGIAIGAGSGAGTAPPGPGPTDPLTIITSVNNRFFFTADAGFTASDWTDQGPNTFHAIQATGANQPSLQSAALNGHDAVRFGGSAWMVVGTLDLPQPGTTPTFFLAGFKVNSDVTNGTVFGGGSSTKMRLFRGSPTSLRCNNGVNGTLVARTVGTWYRIEAYFADSASDDYLKIGSTNGGTGTAQGNNDAASGAFTIGAQQSAGSNPVDGDLLWLGAWDGKPTGTELTNIDTWATGYYGASLNV